MDANTVIQDLTPFVVAGATVFLGHYIKAKASNLATKEDVSDLTYLRRRPRTSLRARIWRHLPSLWSESAVTLEVRRNFFDAHRESMRCR